MNSKRIKTDCGKTFKPEAAEGNNEAVFSESTG